MNAQLHTLSHSASPTAVICENLEYYGGGPAKGDPDTRAVWDHDEALAGLDTILDGTQLADERESLLWGFVNTLHMQSVRLDRAIDKLSPKLKDLQNSQDGSEVQAWELERIIERAQHLGDRRDAFEQLRDGAAERYRSDTGNTWRPRHGSHTSRTSQLTSAAIDARDFLRARESEKTKAHLPKGTLVAVAGSGAVEDADPNRAFEALRSMLRTARAWGELGSDDPDACANIVKNPRRFVLRHLNKAELARLGEVLDQCCVQRPWSVAALKLLMLTGARLSEIINLRWEEIGELSGESGSARLGDSKTGPRTIWLGPEAVRLLLALPRREDDPRVFPKNLTTSRLYPFWTRVREKVELPGVRIHDLRHSFASQGVMNGVGLPTVGQLLGHRRRETTAMYAHLDDAALKDAARRAADVIARAMRFQYSD